LERQLLERNKLGGSPSSLASAAISLGSSSAAQQARCHRKQHGDLLLRNETLVSVARRTLIRPHSLSGTNNSLSYKPILCILQAEEDG
jgi:hypothetical protein